MQRFAILLLLSAPSASPAANVITESMTINDGDIYGPLEIRDGTQGQTTVKMNGGSVEDILALDSSRVEVAGGFLTNLAIRSQSSALLRGGEVTILSLGDGADLAMSGGRTFLVFAVNDSASAHVSGGIVQSGVGLSGNAKLDVDGGQWEGLLHATEDSTLALRNFQTIDGVGLWATDRSRVNLFASSTQFDPVSLALTGTWLDGQPFSIQLHDAETFGHVTIVPEPLTLALFAAAAFGHRRRSQSHTR